MVSLKSSRLLSPKEIPRHPPNRKQGGPHCRSGYFDEEKNLQPMSTIENFYHSINNCCSFFHLHTVQHLDIIKVFYSPTDAQVNCLKNNFQIYIKIYIKTAPTCFSAVTPSSGSALFVLAKVTFVKIEIKIYRCVVMWLHILVGPCWCVYVALFGSRLLLVCVRCTVRE